MEYGADSRGCSIVPANRGRSGSALTEAHLSIVRAMGYDPVSLEVLLKRTRMQVSELQSALLALELEGAIRVESGRYAVLPAAPLQGN